MTGRMTVEACWIDVFFFFFWEKMGQAQQFHYILQIMILFGSTLYKYTLDYYTLDYYTILYYYTILFHYLNHIYIYIWYTIILYYTIILFHYLYYTIPLFHYYSTIRCTISPWNIVIWEYPFNSINSSRRSGRALGLCGNYLAPRRKFGYSNRESCVVDSWGFNCYRCDLGDLGHHGGLNSTSNYGYTATI